MQLKNSLKFFTLFVLFGVIISSCSKEPEETIQLQEHQLLQNADPTIALEWNELYLEIERYLVDFRPNPTARAMAYIGLAAYEATLPGNPNLKSMEDLLPGFNHPGPSPEVVEYWRAQIEGPAYWEVVLNHTYYLCFKHFLLNMSRDHIFDIDALYFEQAKRLAGQLSGQGYQNAIDRAELIANAIIEYAQSDVEGATQIHEVEPEDYTPPTGKGFWQPTQPDFKNACHPYWYKVRRFIIPQEGIAFVPPAPYSEDPSSRFYIEAKEVNDVVQNLSNEDRWIAEFWSDDIVGITFSPPARQLAIANQLVEQTQITLDNALHMYLRLGLALNDASVTCWEGKYEFDLERPIDYIRRVINPDFTTILGDAEHIPNQNPNFPAYPSGHSTFASAGASVFDLFFDVSDFTDRCHEGRIEFNGTPRTFNDFHAMAVENAYSRIPLGVHFRMDCDEGLRLGYEVGSYVTNFSLRRS